MTDTAIETRTRDGVRRVALPRSAGTAVAAVILATVVLDVVWLVRFRHGYVTEWDESGYLQFSLSNYDTLRSHGPWGFAKIVGGRGTFGPLLPAVTALAYPVVGRTVFGSLLVLPLFFVGLVAAAYGLARRFVSASWAAVAAFGVAAVPAVTDYTRLFHFALPATACMTAALWALVRSEGFKSVRWSLAFGVFVALTLLSRTMTVAYIPGFALAAAVQFLVAEPSVRAKLRNLALATAATAVVAGPWYLANARSVYDLLVGTGYGEAATAYGRHYSIASWGYWTKELRIDLSYLWLPLAATLALSFLFALAYRLAQRGLSLSALRSLRAAGLLAVTAVVLEGYVALTSSRNEGTAFALPWLPALVILGVIAAASLPRPRVRFALAAVFVVVSIGAVFSKSGFVAPLATPRSVSVPALGRVLVTDGSGIIQREIAGDGYKVTPLTSPPAAMHRQWLPVARDVVDASLRLAARRGVPLKLTLGLDDRIFGNSRLIFAAQYWHHFYLPVDYLQAAAGGDSVSSYRHQLASPTRENALVTGEPPPNGSSITRSKVETAARSLGFKRIRSFSLPDGRTIWLWWRAEAGAA
jgi:4-amino-4-deoxy-L-arabinose transferase-like glycosyltransferase